MEQMSRFRPPPAILFLWPFPAMMTKAMDIRKECGADGWVARYEEELAGLWGLPGEFPTGSRFRFREESCNGTGLAWMQDYGTQPRSKPTRSSLIRPHRTTKNAILDCDSPTPYHGPVTALDILPAV